MKFNFIALKPDGSMFYSEDTNEFYPISRLMYLMDKMYKHLREGAVTHIIIEKLED